MEYVGEGVDYNSGLYNVQFDAGVTRSSFDVMINDDNILESDESFGLFINVFSLPNNVTIDYPEYATVTIMDNDGE